MGCPNSKPKARHQRKSKETHKVEENNSCEDATSETDKINRRDQETINTIKKDLNETPEMFVLNNILMSTIFFRNYQEDIRSVLHEDRTRALFWEPDIIMEKANMNVVYRPMHGPKKDMAEPLVRRRIYVPLNDIIDVYNPLDDTEDIENSSRSKYKVRIEESKRQGFVKLRRITAEYNHDGSSMKDVPVASSSNNSGSDTESTGTSVGMVINENPQLIKDQDEVGLDDCFVYRKVKKPDIDLELEDMDHENLKEEDIYDIVSYLPSRKFMKYFQSKVFRETIAQKLGLVKYEVDNAIVDEHIPGKVFCNVRDDNGNSYPVEVMPCLKCSWPYKQTYDFLDRKSPSTENEDGSVQWPTNETIQALKRLECALVPKGYTRKRGIYPEGDLEWEIHFPLAEGCLESLLTPQQIKCYLLLVTIYKEYLEPITKSQGIVPDHLITLILWESERNYRGWPEHRLGAKLVNIIENFSNMLSQRVLRDYFIRRKNIFKNVSRKYLEYANEHFHKIKQSPVMSILKALRNIRYNSGKFYPPLNYKELLRIICKKDWDKNPHLSLPNLNSTSPDSLSVSSTSLDRKPKFDDAVKQLEYLKEKEMRRKLMEKLKKENEIKTAKSLSYNVTKDVRRESCTSINDDWEWEKRFDHRKKIALLKFFITNYLDIAKTSFKIGSKTQTSFYLKQAWYLTKILEEENRLFTEEVLEFFKTIKELEDRVNGIKQTNRTKYGRKEDELEEDLANLDDVSSKGADVKQQIKNGDVDIHQQIRKTKINLKSLTRSFSTTYSGQKSVESFR